MTRLKEGEIREHQTHQATRADLPGIMHEHLRQGGCLPFSATPRVRLRRLHDGCSEGHRAHSAHHPGPPSLPGQRDGTIHESKHFARFRLRQLPYEVSSFVTPPSACLNGDNHQVTPTGCEDFRVLGLLVHPGSSQHGSVCGGRIGLSFAGPPQSTSQSHVNGQLRSTEARQILGQHFDSPFV